MKRWILALGLVSCCLVRPALAADPPDYLAAVQPILAGNCYRCHGPDKQSSGLRLDQRGAAFKGGRSGQAGLVKGQPDASRVIKVISGQDDELSMPPGRQKLSPEDVATLTAWVATGADWPEPKPAGPDFRADIRPLLAANCFRCHGPTKQASVLRLDQREAAFKGGKSGQAAIVAGQPDESRLIKVTSGKDPAISMPPGDKKLSAEDLATLTEWIANGAVWPDPIDYATQIQPLLQARCYECHSGENRKGGLFLDRPDEAFAGGDSGKPAIVPGKPDESELVRLISLQQKHDRMPPTGKLPDEEIALLKAWIEEGAVWPVKEASTRVQSDHWAFQPRQDPTPPEIEAAAWDGSPIDRFVYAKLQQAGLHPSAEADRQTLIRRLNLDLLGLPPSPEDVEAFVANQRPDAYERVVDQVLASPHFGERWGRYWLDLARYADSDGYEKDGQRPWAWRYRDWVIDAINKDLPYDKFTIEQLAGDLLPDATVEDQVATGFHRNTLTNREGGVDAEEFRVAQILDRTNTTATVFLGLTMACAQCHSHKYDPLSQREYYQLYSFFNDADERDISAPSPRELAAYNAEKEVFDAVHATLQEDVDAQVATYTTDALPANQAAWEAEPRRWEANWLPLDPTQLASTFGGSELTADANGVIRAGDARPDRDTYRVVLQPPAEPITGLRLELLKDETEPKGGPGRAANGNLVISEVELAKLAGDGTRTPIKLATGTADHSQGGFPVADSIDGDSGTGWALLPAIGQDHAAVYTLAEPVTTADGEQLEVRIAQNYGTAHTVGKFRLAITTAKEPAAESEWVAPKVTIAESAGGPTFHHEANDVIFVDGENPPLDTYTIVAETDLPQITAVKLEALADERLPNQGPGRVKHGNFVVSELKLSVTPKAEGKSQPIKLTRPTATYENPEFTAITAFDGKVKEKERNGWSVHPEGYSKDQELVAETVDAPNFEGGTKLTIVIEQRWGQNHTLGKFRLSVTGDPQPMPHHGLPEDVRTALETPAAKRDEAQVARLAEWYRGVDPFLASQQARLETHLAEAPKLPETKAQAIVERAEPRETHVLTRGDFLRPGAEVQPGTPAVLPPLQARGERPDRLDLAEWLVDDANPLTARVEANRIWQHLFGAGLVRTTDDFGTRGDPPTHPELLDWLADELLRQGWSRKALIREIVLSRTYRQSSQVDPGQWEVDPNNHLLSRQSRFRPQAEILRDLALSAGGLLNEAVGGPSVRPPLPPGIKELGYNNSVKWPESKGDAKYRRGLYIFFQRTVPYPMLMTFDAPDSTVTCTRRERSNTPLQALTLLNDPVFGEAAQALGRRVMQSAERPAKRVERAFLIVLSRPPTATEAARLEQYRQQVITACAADAEKAKQIAGMPEPVADQACETASWVAVARVLLNLDEFMTRE